MTRESLALLGLHAPGAGAQAPASSFTSLWCMCYSRSLLVTAFCIGRELCVQKSRFRSVDRTICLSQFPNIKAFSSMQPSLTRRQSYTSGVRALALTEIRSRNLRGAPRTRSTHDQDTSRSTHAVFNPEPSRWNVLGRLEVATMMLISLLFTWYTVGGDDGGTLLPRRGGVKEVFLQIIDLLALCPEL